MNRNDNDDTDDSDDPGQSDATAQGKDRPLIVRGPGRRRKESAVIVHGTADLGREKAVTAREYTAGVRENAAGLREDAADGRENAVHLREGTATARELEMSTNPGSDNQMDILQQANAHLVISSIEAHKMAEQIQVAKDQLDHLAHFDVLTGLPNRVLLQDRLD